MINKDISHNLPQIKHSMIFAECSKTNSILKNLNIIPFFIDHYLYFVDINATFEFFISKQLCI